MEVDMQTGQESFVYIYPSGSPEFTQGRKDLAARAGLQRVFEPLRGRNGKKIILLANQSIGSSLAVQWLRLCAPNAGDMGSIPGQGIEVPHAPQHGQIK